MKFKWKNIFENNRRYTKKGEFFGLLNRTYLELNLKDKKPIRYESINKYPNNP